MHTLRAGLATLGALFLATAPGASADMTQQKQELIRELVAASGGAIPTESTRAESRSRTFVRDGATCPE